jgi:hypothetical protein
VPPAPPVLVAPQRAGEPAERREPKDPRDGADERRRIPEVRQGQRERDAAR